MRTIIAIIITLFFSVFSNNICAQKPSSLRILKHQEKIRTTNLKNRRNYRRTINSIRVKRVGNLWQKKKSTAGSLVGGFANTIKINQEQPILSLLAADTIHRIRGPKKLLKNVFNADDFQRISSILDSLPTQSRFQTTER